MDKCKLQEVRCTLELNFIVIHCQILPKLLGVCMDGKERLKYRLINKKCNYFASDSLNKSGFPTRQIANGKKMEEFLGVLGSRLEVNKIPFGKFSLALEHIPMTAITKFTTECGPYARQYAASYSAQEADYVSGPATTEQVGQIELVTKLATLLSNSPHLDTVEILMDDFDLPDEDLSLLPPTFPHLKLLVGENMLPAGNGRSFVETVANRSPGLGHLVLRQLKLVPGSLSRLPSVLYEPNRRQVPTLALNTSLRDDSDVEALRALNSRGFKHLRSLRCRLVFHGATSRALLPSLNDLLAAGSDSLTELSLTAFNFPSNMESPLLFCFPQAMKKLTLLRLGNQLSWHSLGAPDQFGLPTHLMRPLQPDQFPVLRTLEISMFKRLQTWLSPTVVYPSVRELKFTQYELDGPAQNVALHKNFPNLETLIFACYPGGAMVRYILTHMKSLEGLTMGIGCPLDHSEPTALWNLYTGRSPRISKEEMLKLFQGNCKTDDEGGPDSSGPSFANLKREFRSLQWKLDPEFVKLFLCHL